MRERFNLLAFCLFIILFIPNLNFADPPDPLARNKVLGNSSELIAVWPKRGDEVFAYRRVWDLTDTGLYQGGQYPAMIINPEWSRKMIDVTTGDYDGDGKDDIVTATVYADEVKLEIPEVSYTEHYFALDYGFIGQETAVYYGYESQHEYGNVHLTSGNFDEDANQEFALAFWDAAQKRIEITVYKADDLSSPEKVIENDDIYMNELLREAGTFDMTAGDFNCDGIDEIIIAHGLYGASNDFRVAVKVFRVDMAGAQLNVMASLDSLFKYDPGNPANSEGDYVERIAVATGNFDTADCADEAVICYQHSFADWISGHYWTKQDYYMQPVDISSNLNEFDYDINNRVYHHKDWLDHQATSTFSGFSMSVASGDLNLDGKDDIVWAVNDRFVGLTTADDLSLNEEFRIIRGVLWSDASFHTTLITDMNVDPDDEKWYPEIVLQDWVANAESRIRVFQAELDYDGNFTGNLITLATVEGNNRHTNQMAIAAGDFDGDGVRIGDPTYREYTEFSQPTVILNPPPVHFDVFDNVIYDINGIFNQDFNSNPFQSIYEVVTTNSTETISEANSDWGIDASLEASANYMGVGVTASMKASYGEGFSNTNATAKTISVGQTEVVRADRGLICVAETDFDIWEYPVLSDVFDTVGYILVVNPSSVQEKWVSTKFWDDNKYIPNHEPGNLMSYPQYDDIAEEDPEVDELIYQGSKLIEYGSSGDWWLEMEDFASNTVSASNRVNFEVGASISGYGIEVGVGAHYNQEQINTHTTTFNSDLQLGLNVGGIDNQYSAEYNIYPYTYWANNGALVLDYCVEPLVEYEGVPTFWANYYGEYPDPALILPYRCHPQKGWELNTEDELEITHDIILDPQVPVPDSLLKITGRIHNFSMIDCPSDIEVAFYLNDPDDGGILISPGIMTFNGGLDSRKTGTVSFEWNVPIGMPQHARIYAVLDPEDKIEEIHENNNKGWKYVETPGGTPTDIGNDDYMAVLPERFGITRVYPNPFNPSTTIQFALESRSRVKVMVYNILGQRVVELADETLPAGHHEVEWNGRNDAGKPAASGIYFCHIKTETESDSKKMLLLK